MRLHVFRAVLALALLCPSPVEAQAAAAPVEAASVPAGAEVAAGAVTEDPRHAAALEAVAAGEYESARALLAEILFDRHLAEAVALLDANNPQDGLLAVDRALDLEARSAQGLLVRGRGSLMLGRFGIDEGRSAIFVSGAFEDALASYESVLSRRSTDAQRVEAQFGASRAAFMQSDLDAALAYATAGMQSLAGGAEATGLDVLPERTLAEASYAAFVARKGSDEDATELFEGTRSALERLLGRTPEDAWPWVTLSRLWRWEAYHQASVITLERGLEVTNDPTSLLAELSLAARAGSEGELASPAAVAAFGAYLGKHPDEPLGHWFRAMERFNDGVWRLEAGRADAALFEAAEADFARARSLDESLTREAKGWEVLCRNGRGWALYNAEEWESALAAFRSTGELAPDGLEYALGGQLLSALSGLEFTAAKYNELERFGAAADLFDELRAYQPEEVSWANNAGFFHRDAGVELEAEADALCRIALGEELASMGRAALARVQARRPEFDSSPEAARALSEELRTQAWEHMRKSYEAYTIAAQLAPEDVRVVNDTALIQVYYLHEADEHAEALLRRCFTMGSEQLEGDLDEDERETLLNAWGDAYQNLGVLYLRLGKKAEARELFERSVEIGPDPRQLITLLFLPLCDGDPAAEARIEQAEGVLPWGVPCS